MCYKDTTFIFLILIFYLTTARSQVQIKWMAQKLNNSDTSESNAQLWSNRYFINDIFAIPNGPIFIFVNSGSEAIDLQWLTHGLMYDLAAQHNAVLLSLEPRFYGESRPTSDTSVESLQFLSHDQILDDLSNFIKYYKINNANHTESKVVLWGDGFGATYAVWLKMKFPELVDGVWASNARLLSVAPAFSGYFDRFGATLSTLGGIGCFLELQKTFQDIEYLISTQNTSEIEREFLLCFPIDTYNDLDIDLFIGYLIETIDKALRQSNNEYINRFCGIISNQENEHSNNIFALAAWMRSEFREENCVMASYRMIFPSLRSTSWNTITTQPAGLRQWYWQLCSEFATFRITEGAFQPFPDRLSISLYHELCRRLFGDQFTPELILKGSETVNSKFGGLNPSVNNVYFTNSALNSYWFLARTENLNDDSPSDSYPEGQLNDLRSINIINDSITLRLIKIRVLGLVETWIER